MTQALVNKAKEKFPSYKFYLVGSMARMSPRPNDIDIGIIPILLSIKIFKHGYIGLSLTLFDYLDFEICLGTRSKEKLNN